MSVGIHPPKTPVTKGSNSIACATLPNVCKMPGPPAPFVPTPLPNIAKSGDSPKGYSKKVKIKKNPIAIRGATFKSMGDVASKGTGGGLVSANTHGPAKFIMPGSMTVHVEGKAVHLLGESMLNNCAASGTPPNTGATMMGAVHGPTTPDPSCPHPKIEVEEVDREQEREEAQQRVDAAKAQTDDAKQAVKDAEAELASPPKGARKATLRQNVKKAQKKVPKAEGYQRAQEAKLKSVEAEQKVADDTGGGNKGYKFVCAKCKEVVGEIDVLTADNKAKEVKQSEGGFRSEQFDNHIDLIESQGLLGPGVTVEVAIVHDDSQAICDSMKQITLKLQVVHSRINMAEYLSTTISYTPVEGSIQEVWATIGTFLRERLRVPAQLSERGAILSVDMANNVVDSRKTVELKESVFRESTRPDIWISTGVQIYLDTAPVFIDISVHAASASTTYLEVWLPTKAYMTLFNNDDEQKSFNTDAKSDFMRFSVGLARATVLQVLAIARLWRTVSSARKD